MVTAIGRGASAIWRWTEGRSRARPLVEAALQAIGSLRLAVVEERDELRAEHTRWSLTGSVGG
jgi:hypothetical protein